MEKSCICKNRLSSDYLEILLFRYFGGHFWVYEIFENVFGMRMCDFWEVYLVTFIQILPPSAFLEYFLILGFWGFLGSFLSFWNFRKCFWNENGWLWGGLFSNFYSDFASFCLFGIFLNFGFLRFFGVIFEFLKFLKMLLEWEWVTLGGSI